MEVITYSSNVTKLTTEIKVIQDNVCQGMIEIGKRLIEIKKELGCERWLIYVNKELGYSKTTAYDLVNVSIKFGGDNFRLIGNLQSTKILALLSMPKEELGDFIENHNIA